jgi:hypothetical protein
LKHISVNALFSRSADWGDWECSVRTWLAMNMPGGKNIEYYSLSNESKNSTKYLCLDLLFLIRKNLVHSPTKNVELIRARLLLGPASSAAGISGLPTSRLLLLLMLDYDGTSISSFTAIHRRLSTPFCATIHCCRHN